MRVQWKWWVSSDGEIYRPAGSTREQAIQNGIQEEIGAEFEFDHERAKTTEFWAYKRISQRFHIVEARQDPVMIGRWIDAGRLLERALEDFEESEQAGEDPLEAEITPAQERDLEVVLLAAITQWQQKHQILPRPWTFTASRNAEEIEVLADGTVRPVPKPFKAEREASSAIMNLRSQTEARIRVIAGEELRTLTTAIKSSTKAMP